MPYEVRATVRQTPFIWQRQTWVNGVQTENGQLIDTIPVDTSEITRSWVRTPNFWALRRARAQLPENPWSRSGFRVQEGNVVFESVDFPAPNTRVRRYFSRNGEVLAKLPTDHGITLTQFDLYSGLIDKARKSDFSLPIALAEASRTVQMVAQTATSLASTIRNLRRGNLVGAMQALSLEPSQSQVRRFNRRFGVNPNTTAANYWLQLQYGWIPLLNDVKNAAEAVAEAVSRNGDDSTTFVTKTSRRRGSRIYEDYVLQVSPAFRGRVTVNVSISRKAKWRFKPKAADLPGLFGLTNPAEVVWEIIPFSFVADWFLPIGNYLSALDAPLRFQHVGGSEGYRIEMNAVTEIRSATFPDGFFFDEYEGGTLTRQYHEVNRTPITSIPVPQLSDMRFNPGLNARRVTSSIALLWQQASRLGR